MTLALNATPDTDGRVPCPHPGCEERCKPRGLARHTRFCPRKPASTNGHTDSTAIAERLHSSLAEARRALLACATAGVETKESPLADAVVAYFRLHDVYYGSGAR